MDETKKSTTTKKPRNREDIAIASMSTAAGAVAGGVVTSSPAIAVAGTGGLTGYAIGLGSVLTKVGCGSAFAIGAFSVIAAGPVLGGLFGYSVYKAVKDKQRQNGQKARTVVVKKKKPVSNKTQ